VSAAVRRWRVVLPAIALLGLIAIMWSHWGPAIFVAGLGGMLC
jgi:hypothetical protein